MPERALLHQRAHELREKERIALGVAIDEREKLAPDLLFMERGRQPLLHLVAREAVQENFRIEWIALETLPALGRVGEFALGATGEEDQDAFARQPADDVRQRLPRRVVRP